MAAEGSPSSYPVCLNKACGLRHPPHWPCKKARLLASNDVVTQPEPVANAVVTTPEPVVTQNEDVVTKNSDRHKDKEAHKAYMRAYMKRRRAERKPLGVPYG